MDQALLAPSSQNHPEVFRMGFEKEAVDVVVFKFVDREVGVGRVRVPRSSPSALGGR